MFHVKYFAIFSIFQSIFEILLHPHAVARFLFPGVNCNQQQIVLVLVGVNLPWQIQQKYMETDQWLVWSVPIQWLEILHWKERSKSRITVCSGFDCNHQWSKPQIIFEYLLQNEICYCLICLVYFKILAEIMNGKFLVKLDFLGLIYSSN